MDTPATLTAVRWREICAHHHAQAELAHRRYGAVTPLLLLFGAGDPTLVALPDGARAAGVAEQLGEIARHIGAQAAVLSAEAWMAHPSISPDALARLDPADLPRPSEMTDKRECLITSGIWPSGHVVRHRVTMITRTPCGTVLGAARWLDARDYGANRWLESLLPPP